MEGSALVAVASSKEEIIERLKKDIYAESGVWDLSKVCPAQDHETRAHNMQIQVYPFKCAFRIESPMPS